MKISISFLFMGLVAFFMGLIFFSQVFTEHHETFHSDLIETILLGGVGLILMLMGVGLFGFGLFGRVFSPTSSSSDNDFDTDKNVQPENLSIQKVKSNKIFPYGLTAIFIYIILTADSWNFNYLADYYDNVVYVEMPGGEILVNQATQLNLTPKFYQFKPGFFGNKKPYYLKLNANHYHMAILPMDSETKRSVLIDGNQINITKVGQYLLSFSIKSTSTNKFQFRLGNFSRNNDYLAIRSTISNEWQRLEPDKIPADVKQQADILEEYFPTDRAGGLTYLKGKYYLNYSYTFHNRTASTQFNSNFHTISQGEGVKTSRWTPNASIYNNFIIAHQGKILSFGGYEHQSKEGAGNWIYSQETDSWQPLSNSPRTNENRSRFSPSIASAFSVRNNLYVIIKEKKYTFYQIEISDVFPRGRWRSVKEFSLLSKLEKWRFLDENTLYAYEVNYPWVDDHKEVKGYIQTLDLTSFKTKTLSQIPILKTISKSSSLISIESYEVRVIAYEGLLYLAYAGQVYQMR